MAGCYGKVPALGDFLSRNLPARFVETWYGWVRGALAECARAGGDRWRDRYLAGPVWRFAIAPPAAGGAGRIGVLAPSADRLGRCFPMLVARPVPEGAPVLEHALAWTSGLDDAEAAVRAVIAGRLPPETFVAVVEGLPEPQGIRAPLPAILGRWSGDSAPGLGILAGGAPGDPPGGEGHMSALALSLLADALGGYSIWWHRDAEGGEARTVLFSGLPPPPAARGMLTGSWTDWDGDG